MIQFEPDENIVKVVRRHYFVVVPMITTILFASLVPIFLYAFIMSDFIALSEVIKNNVSIFVKEWKVFAYSIWLLILWTIFFIEWTDYYLDIWILTNKRIIDVEQKGFFHREVTSFRYAQIQDITVETHGLIETFLKFGTLHIQTAGTSREIIIRDAHYPEEARSLILKLSKEGNTSLV